MTTPFYVAPEQMMKDRADYARKGIARGRSLIAMSYEHGVFICAENPSSRLHKVSEIYDRIAFAGVGKYNEFDQLRIAGVRHADMKGFTYSREDVEARSLANNYAQMLGQTFTHEMKPMEVEILVAEITDTPGEEQLFHILYDGTVVDENHFVVLGGDSEAIATRVSENFKEVLARQQHSSWRERPWLALTVSSPIVTSRSQCSTAIVVVAHLPVLPTRILRVSERASKVLPLSVLSKNLS